MKRNAAVETKRRRRNTASRYMVNCHIFRNGSHWGYGGLCLFILSRSGVKVWCVIKVTNRGSTEAEEGLFEGQLQRW